MIGGRSEEENRPKVTSGEAQTDFKCWRRTERMNDRSEVTEEMTGAKKRSGGKTGMWGRRLAQNT
jgi:hypothetical protein